jgi:hypothetical protein
LLVASGWDPESPCEIVPPEDQPSLRLVEPDELEDVSPEVVVTAVLAVVDCPECAATTAKPPVAAIRAGRPRALLGGRWSWGRWSWCSSWSGPVRTGV